MEFVIKRDGSQVTFSKEKIYDAVEAATLEVQAYGQPFMNYKEICDAVEDIFARCEEIEGDAHVEQIQDIVETVLMAYNSNVARAYIRYRYKKEVAREYKADFFEAIGSKLAATNVENQNANVDEHSFGGRVGEASDTMMKEYALNFCMSKKSRENHLNNEIYIHDLSAYAVGMHNCLSVPFDHLLAKGFNTRQADIRPANSVDTAFQLIAVIFQLQSLQQFGGVSATHLDWTMVPYVRKSFTKHLRTGMKHCENKSDYKLDRFLQWLKYDLHMDGTVHFDDESFRLLHPEAWDYAMEQVEKETMQAVEGMYHNLNTLQSRSGNQLPFTSINYGTCTSPEGRMIIKCLLQGSLKGVGKHHRTPIFPCGIFQVGEGINKYPGDPNYDLFLLALESTAKRLYPNYANIDWTGNAGYDKNDPRTYFSTMGCRTANGWDVNGLGQQKDGRGNICPVTIIMPTIAMEAKQAFALHEYSANETTFDTVEIFMKLLDQKIHEAKDMLIERFEYICRQSPESAKFMYENGLMAGYKPKEGIRSALKHGTIVIGQLGLAETLELLIGCNHTSPKGMELAKQIEQLFKTRCAEFKEEYKLNFGVYYTPAENLCYTAMKKFQNKYGVIPKVSDQEYFTNSIHVPVWEKVGVLEKIDIESQLTGYSSAGCITYVELESGIKNNLKALEQIVIYAMNKDIPYLAINVPNDTCLDCGYCDEFNNQCPECGSTNIQQLRRVTGYLTGNYKTAFNYGKQKETEARVKHTGNMEE